MSDTKSTGDRSDICEGSSGLACKNPSTRPLVKRPWKGGAKPTLLDDVEGKDRAEGEKRNEGRGLMRFFSGERARGGALIRSMAVVV